jgi:hypothetical protein
VLFVTVFLFFLKLQEGMRQKRLPKVVTSSMDILGSLTIHKDEKKVQIKIDDLSIFIHTGFFVLTPR